MKINKIDFSELEIDEIGSWPYVLRIAVIVAASIVAIAAVYFLLLDGETNDLINQKKNEYAKRDEFKEKYNLSANLDAYQKQMIDMNEAYKDVSKQLPSDSNIPDLIDNISKLAENNHLKYKSILLGEPKSLSGFYKELPIDLNLTGKYHNFAKFIEDISKLPRIVTIHDFTIAKADASASKQDTGLLTMTVKIKTYWLSNDADTAPNPTGSAPGSAKQIIGPSQEPKNSPPLNAPSPKMILPGKGVQS